MSTTDAPAVLPSRPTDAPGSAPEGRWPRRRLVAGVLTAPLLAAAFIDAGGGWAPAEAPLWTALVAMTAVLGAAVLATYVPARGEGLRAALGCSPCAVASAASVLGAAVLLASGPHEPTMAVVALGLVGFGMLRRRSGMGDSCPA